MVKKCLSRMSGKLSRTVLRRGKGSNPFSLVDYTSNIYRQVLSSYGAVQSMSNTGKCYDNARMESFFATLKKERIYKFKTENMNMDTVKSMVFRFIEIYYNRKRIYTTNGGFPPLEKRSNYYRDRLLEAI
jgi:transposase InsO family protein